MRKIYLLALLFPLAVGCKGLDRLISGSDQEPSAPFTLPTKPPPVTVWDVPLPSPAVLPLKSGSGLVLVASGRFPNDLVGTIQTSRPATEGYVRRIDTHEWIKLREGTSSFSSRPYFTNIEGGVSILKLYGEYDVFALYSVY